MFKSELTVAETVQVAVQVNGKVRDRIELPADAGEADAIAAALATFKVSSLLEGKEVKSARYVAGRNGGHR